VTPEALDEYLPGSVKKQIAEKGNLLSHFSLSWHRMFLIFSSDVKLYVIDAHGMYTMKRDREREREGGRGHTERETFFQNNFGFLNCL
jgi:hypothetical protein